MAAEGKAGVGVMVGVRVERRVGVPFFTAEAGDRVGVIVGTPAVEVTDVTKVAGVSSVVGEAERARKEDNVGEATPEATWGVACVESDVGIDAGVKVRRAASTVRAITVGRYSVG